MDYADSTQDTPLPLPPGYSLPIRAPLTIDSDSELGFSINNNNNQNYSRTSSFNSSSSSIDISSYGDEHTSIFEAYPDNEIVNIETSHFDESLLVRPFAKESCEFSDSINFRPFVKIPFQESGGDGFGVESSVPIAPLTNDCDGDDDFVDGGRWDDSGWVPDDGIMQKVAMVLKVRSFSGDEGDNDCVGDGDGDGDDDFVDGRRWDDSGWVRADGVLQKVAMVLKVRSFSGDEGDNDVIGSDSLNSVLVESVENEECEVKCLDEVVELSESGVSSFDLGRIDVQIVLNSDSEIGSLKSVSTESVENEGCEVKCLDEVVELSDSGASSFDLGGFDAQIVSNLDSEIEYLNSVSTESIQNEGFKVKCLNAIMKLSESGASSFDSERIDAQIVSNSDSEIENLNSVSTESVENECLTEVSKLSESDASGFDSERIDSQTVPSLNNEIDTETINVTLSESDEPSMDSDSEIENFNSVTTESFENEGCKVECFNEVMKPFAASSFDLERINVQTLPSSNNEVEIETINPKLSESDEPSFDSERTDAHIVSHSNNEQETVSEKEEQMLKKMQRVRAKFLRLALNEQLTTKVNGEGGNYNFDFDLTVLVIGKTGVGKSATINSIFGENKAITSAFDPGTTTIQELTGNVDGIQLRVIDTPGLKCSSSDRSYNLRVLKSIKRFTRNHAPNVVLYVDRLDTRDDDDSRLLTLITSSLGSSVWHSCIIALTHATCDLPNDPSSGFVVHRCRFIQEQIISCGGYNRRVANPVWLVDNHPSCKHDVIDHVQPFEWLSEPRDVINRSRDGKNAYFTEYDYRVKLVGNKHWSLGCRLCI